MENTNCVLRRRADTGAFASGHSAATTDSTLISHFAFNHNDVIRLSSELDETSSSISIEGHAFGSRCEQIINTMSGTDH